MRLVCPQNETTYIVYLLNPFSMTVGKNHIGPISTMIVNRVRIILIAAVDRIIRIVNKPDI